MASPSSIGVSISSERDFRSCSEQANSKGKIILSLEIIGYVKYKPSISITYTRISSTFNLLLEGRLFQNHTFETEWLLRILLYFYILLYTKLHIISAYRYNTYLCPMLHQSIHCSEFTGQVYRKDGIGPKSPKRKVIFFDLISKAVSK